MDSVDSKALGISSGQARQPRGEVSLGALRTEDRGTADQGKGDPPGGRGEPTAWPWGPEAARGPTHGEHASSARSGDQTFHAEGVTLPWQRKT